MWTPSLTLPGPSAPRPSERPAKLFETRAAIPAASRALTAFARPSKQATAPLPESRKRRAELSIQRTVSQSPAAARANAAAASFSPRRDRRGAIAAARPSGSAASVSATGATPSRNTIDPVPFFIADLAPNPWADVVRNRDRACERELFDARPPAEPKEIYRADPTALARAAPR